jgi:alkanesulfonate monooxygenase SsuD/methylene tetrahydromethanopterin reductase-like flavin-dependent oxidoreductase (luciferase family)
MGSAGSAAQVAQRGHIGGVFLAGYPKIRTVFDGYRQGYLDTHGSDAPIDRLAYCALIHVGKTEKEGLEGAEKLLWYMSSNKVPPQFSNPPGYHSPAMAAAMMRGNNSGTGLPTSTNLAEQMARGNVFAGTPDQVYDQIKNFYDYCGGFGNLMMMSQAGFMTFDETLASMKLFSEEVYPRLKELTAGYDAGEMQEIKAALPDVENVDVSDLASEFVR